MDPLGRHRLPEIRFRGSSDDDGQINKPPNKFSVSSAFLHFRQLALPEISFGQKQAQMGKTFKSRHCFDDGDRSSFLCFYSGYRVVLQKIKLK